MPVHTGSNPKEIADTDELITQVIPLQGGGRDAAQAGSDPADQRDADFTANASSNALIITDTSSNIKRMVEIVGISGHKCGRRGGSEGVPTAVRQCGDGGEADHRRVRRSADQPAGGGDVEDLRGGSWRWRRFWRGAAAVVAAEEAVVAGRKRGGGAGSRKQVKVTASS